MTAGLRWAAENIPRRSDWQRSFQLYGREHERGNISGTCNLGVCYLFGMNVPENHEHAVSLFKIGADRKHPASINNLGRVSHRPFYLFRAYDTVGVCALHGMSMPADEDFAWIAFNEAMRLVSLSLCETANNALFSIHIIRVVERLLPMLEDAMISEKVWQPTMCVPAPSTNGRLKYVHFFSVSLLFPSMAED